VIKKYQQKEETKGNKMEAKRSAFGRRWRRSPREKEEGLRERETPLELFFFCEEGNAAGSLGFQLLCGETTS
jgi:hypothetical protein